MNEIACALLYITFADFLYHRSLRKSNDAGKSYATEPIGGRVDRASATETVDSGSIPGRVIPKTLKIGIHSFPAKPKQYASEVSWKLTLCFRSETFIFTRFFGRFIISSNARAGFLQPAGCVLNPHLYGPVHQSR